MGVWYIIRNLQVHGQKSNAPAELLTGNFYNQQPALHYPEDMTCFSLWKKPPAWLWT